ncbi:MAG TPA: hypothetical protein VK021_06585 [Flavobacteriaceae bacterium]|nr:hypothetical protein [Flavobacteriaceae bacterium]
MESDFDSDFQNSALYKKADDISMLCYQLSIVCRYYEGENEELIKAYGEQIAADGFLIPAKIAGAYGADLYDLKMENAALIRKAARDILAATSGIRTIGLKDEDYIELLRENIEDFRILFAEWVKTFDPWDYIIDRWGLFNPPGIDYDTPDPDDDIPFDPDDFD